MREKILHIARENFFKYGYSKVSIDELIRGAGISKKTIYKYFNSKEELLYALISDIKIEFENELATIEANEEYSYQEKVGALLALVGRWISEMATFFNDLRYNLRPAYDLLVKYRKEVVLHHSFATLKEGVDLGKLRPDAKTHLALYMFLIVAESILDRKYLEVFPSDILAHFPADPQLQLKSVFEIIFEGLRS